METIESLRGSKILLAFSAGVDSSALFFLLLEEGIAFDIALVNYGTRQSANDEESYAHRLATIHHLTAHTTKAPQFESHFEERARSFRYRYFESLIDAHGYDTLLTAHQLDDRLEWFLMRLVRGAGVSELLGMEGESQRTTPKGNHYHLIRPLLSLTKGELLEYLDTHHHHYFLDESNQSMQYERNRFRTQWSNQLITEYKEGIKRSFEYLQKDKTALTQGIELLVSKNELRILKVASQAQIPYAADTTLKQLGYLLSAPQRDEITLHPSVVIGGKWAIATHEGRLFIAPYLTTPIPKGYKERCRIAKIPPKIRPYCYTIGIEPDFGTP